MDLLDLAEAVGRAAEDARVAAVHERDAPALAPREARQRAHQRRVPDRHPVRHAARQLQRLEQVGRLAGEHGERVRAVARKVVLEEAAGALQRGLEGGSVVVREPVPLAQAALGLVDAASGPRVLRAGGVANCDGSRFR